MKNKIILIFSFTIFLALVGKAQQIENSLFWKIDGPGISSPSYLFGTYHLLNSEYLKEIPNVGKKFKQADGVVVEAILDSTKLMQYSSYYFMTNRTLNDLLTPEEIELLTIEIKRAMGVDMSLVKSLKPMALAVNLMLYYTQEQQRDKLKQYDGQPIDLYFAFEAKSRGKSVEALETLEEQMKLMFDHDSVEKQAKYLMEMVKDKKNFQQDINTMSNLYFKEDLGGLIELSKKQEDKYGDMTYILDERNQNWISRLPAMLSEGNKFIAVGALHLGGVNGIVALLRKAGYNVWPLSLH